MPNVLPRVAIATGDPAGIGPEVGLKCALDPVVNAICRPMVVGDPSVIERQATAAGLKATFNVIAEARDAKWQGTPNGALNVYPSFVAKETHTDIHDVFLMLCFGERRIVHTTLHVGVAEAVRLITRERVGRAIKAADTALKRLGIASPKIIVGGLNPHAGEGGLFGREEIEIISPAIEDAKAAGITVEGPYGADTMFPKKCDAFVVMLHDQGHITAKLLAPNQTAGLAIGTPILFSSVAHGSAYDIAGKGVASHAAMVEAIKRLVGARAEAKAA